MKKTWLIQVLSLPIFYENLSLRNTSENGVIDSTNSNGESVSPWRIPRLIGTFPRTEPFDVISTFHVFMLFLKNRLMISATTNISMQSSSHECGTSRKLYDNRCKPKPNSSGLA